MWRMSWNRTTGMPASRNERSKCHPGLRVKRFAVLPREDVAGVDPAVAGGQALLELATTLLAEHGDGARVDGHDVRARPSAHPR